MSATAIDLGTCTTRAVPVDATPSEADVRSWPSVVSVERDGVVAGDGGQLALGALGLGALARLLGLPADHPVARELCEQSGWLAARGSHGLALAAAGRSATVTDAVQALLRPAGHGDATLVVPAWWLPEQCVALGECARAVGLNPGAMISDVAAAALWHVRWGTPGCFAVVDLGAGGIGAAVVQSDGRVVHVAAVDGCPRDAGWDVAQALMTARVGHCGVHDWLPLHQCCDRLARALASGDSATARAPTSRGEVELSATREELEQLLARHISAAATLVDRVRRKTNARPDRLLLTGGLAAQPLVGAALGRAANLPVAIIDAGSSAMVLGAAVHAAVLAGLLGGPKLSGDAVAPAPRTRQPSIVPQRPSAPPPASRFPRQPSQPPREVRALPRHGTRDDPRRRRTQPPPAEAVRRAGDTSAQPRVPVSSRPPLRPRSSAPVSQGVDPRRRRSVIEQAPADSLAGHPVVNHAVAPPPRSTPVPSGAVIPRAPRPPAISESGLATPAPRTPAPASASPVRTPPPRSAPPASISGGAAVEGRGLTMAPPSRAPSSAGEPLLRKSGTLANPTTAPDLLRMAISRPLVAADLEPIALPVLLRRVLPRRSVSGTLALSAGGTSLAMDITSGTALLDKYELADLMTLFERPEGSYRLDAERSQNDSRTAHSLARLALDGTRKMLRQLMADELEQAFADRLEQAPRIKEERRAMPARMQLTGRERRFIDHHMDGVTPLSHLMAHGGLGRASALQLVGLLELFDVIDYGEAAMDTGPTVFEQLDELVYKMGGQDHFVRVGAHWSAADDELHEAYEHTAAAYRQGGPNDRENPDACAKIRQMVKESWLALDSPEKRARYRRVALEAYDFESVSDLQEKRSESLAMRGETHEAEMSRESAQELSRHIERGRRISMAALERDTDRREDKS